MTEFYVGKGSNKRAWLKNESECRTRFWMNTARKHGVIVEIVQCDMREEDAFLLEMWLIAKLRHEGASLCNLTNGGDGVVGYTMTDEVRAKIRANSMKKALQIFCSNGMKFESCMEAVRWLKAQGGLDRASPGNISRASRKGMMAYGLFWSLKEGVFTDSVEFDNMKHNHMRGDMVVMDEHMIFRCISDAAKYINADGTKGGARTMIARCCNGIGNTAYGHTWSFYKGDL